MSPLSTLWWCNMTEINDGDSNHFFIFDDDDMCVRVDDADYYSNNLPDGLTKEMIAKVENWQQSCMRDFLDK